MDRETLTMKEVAAILGIGERTGYRLLAENSFPIPHLRIGNLIRFSRAQVYAYLAPVATSA